MTPAGMAEAASATTVLPPRTAMVVMKTPAVTAIMGAQTTINNQLKAANSGGRAIGSAMPAGMAKAAAATAVLPPRAAAVVMKILVVTAMMGAHTTINNQIKAVTETALEMAKMTATTKQRRRRWRWWRRWLKCSGRAGAAPAWRQWRQLGKSVVLAAVAAWRRRRQWGDG